MPTLPPGTGPLVEGTVLTESRAPTISESMFVTNRTLYMPPILQSPNAYIELPPSQNRQLEILECCGCQTDLRERGW